MIISITKAGLDEGNQAYEFDIDGKKEIRTRESLIEDREGSEIILDNRQMTADQRRQIGVALDRINDQIALIDRLEE
jgi:hypothetical protein